MENNKKYFNYINQIQYFNKLGMRMSSKKSMFAHNIKNLSSKKGKFGQSAGQKAYRKLLKENNQAVR